MPFGKKWKFGKASHEGQGSQRGLDVRPKLNYRTLGPTEIRLVQLHAGSGDAIIDMSFLPHADISDPPPYHALSYTWGDPNQTRAIVIDGVTFQATKNLEEFLRHHRRYLADKLAVLWIDAICINQDDNDEKNIQLLLMQKVYKKAHSTIVWLGPEQEECKKGLELVDKIPRPLNYTPNDMGKVDLNSWLANDDNRTLVKECWLSFINLMALPWFSRIWTKQEYIMSTIIELQYGDKFFGLTDLIAGAPPTSLRS